MHKPSATTQTACFAVSLLFIVDIAYWDYVTIHEIDMSIFYLLPVSLAAWYTGRFKGYLTAFVAVLSWALADWLENYTYKLPWGLYWSSFNHSLFFLATAEITHRLQKAYQAVEQSANLDFLTGLLNRRAFLYLAARELERSRRFGHPLTLCYIDLDHFKQVNDTLGHDAGDRLLQQVSLALTQQLRSIDYIARLGGDEFGLLLPETGEEASALIKNLHVNLQAAMKQANWPVSFSIGAVSCCKLPATIDELIKQADELMYEVKRNGRNHLRHQWMP